MSLVVVNQCWVRECDSKTAEAAETAYNGTFRKRPPLTSGLGGRLLEFSIIAIDWLRSHLEFWLGGRVVAQGGYFQFLK